MLEENFRRALLISRGSFAAFFVRPISGTLLALIGLFVAWQLAAFFLKLGRPGSGPSVEPERAPLGSLFRGDGSPAGDGAAD
jgi:hypothetical protein